MKYKNPKDNILYFEALNKLPIKFVDGETQVEVWMDDTVIAANPKFAPIIYKKTVGRWREIKFEEEQKEHVMELNEIIEDSFGDIFADYFGIENYEDYFGNEIEQFKQQIRKWAVEQLPEEKPIPFRTYDTEDLIEKCQNAGFNQCRKIIKERLERKPKKEE